MWLPLSLLLLALFKDGSAGKVTHIRAQFAETLKMKCDGILYRSYYTDSLCYFAITTEQSLILSEELCDLAFPGAQVSKAPSSVYEKLFVKQSEFHSPTARIRNYEASRKALCIYEGHSDSFVTPKVIEKNATVKDVKKKVFTLVKTDKARKIILGPFNVASQSDCELACKCARSDSSDSDCSRFSNVDHSMNCTIYQYTEPVSKKGLCAFLGENTENTCTKPVEEYQLLAEDPNIYKPVFDGCGCGEIFSYLPIDDRYYPAKANYTYLTADVKQLEEVNCTLKAPAGRTSIAYHTNNTEWLLTRSLTCSNGSIINSDGAIVKSNGTFLRPVCVTLKPCDSCPYLQEETRLMRPCSNSAHTALKGRYVDNNDYCSKLSCHGEDTIQTYDYKHYNMEGRAWMSGAGVSTAHCHSNGRWYTTPEFRLQNTEDVFKHFQGEIGTIKCVKTWNY